MSIHIGAKKGDIAETVLLPGDPARAEFIAEKYLKKVTCYNTVRKMSGYTGIAPNGKRISAQGSGMGMPSLSIYVNELIDQYGVKRIMRVGSAGSLQKNVKCRDIILAQGACSDSAMNQRRFENMSFAPIATFGLLLKAYEEAQRLGLKVLVGNIFSSDIFYEDKPEKWKVFAKYGALAVEMESAELYTLGAKKGIEVLTILTISDNLVAKEKPLSAKDRESTFDDMVQIALNI